ncbi:uncharacterized protein LOC118182673 [Stegodyphus dumicola]|uniref:uncharacterized protein LOC118182673 n=1 Tax=Stegodyphus dumicola TaxID=202533 RepID=UPI0015B1C50F|nr:uncharacterized protein LOC118182673 [Stegodyphus dumicola]
MFYFIVFQLLLATLIYGSNLKGAESVTDTKFQPHKTHETRNERIKRRAEQFNAFDDLRGLIQMEMESFGHESYFDSMENNYSGHRKKSDYKPKYDPGWKFIGLGKRPQRQDTLLSYDREPSKGRIDPLLGISTLINLEFFNALRNGIEDAARETVKKEDSMNGIDGISGEDSGNDRFNNKLSWFGGRQKSMYDPGWMLTGLGKR